MIFRRVHGLGPAFENVHVLGLEIHLLDNPLRISIFKGDGLKPFPGALVGWVVD